MTCWTPVFLAALVALPLTAGGPTAPADPYAPLWTYNGTWQVTRAGAAPESLVNQCGRVGQYFGCQQTVNGAVVGLLLIIPAQEPGHYYTQTVLPRGRATGLGELEIAGDRWTFLSSQPGTGKVTHYRTVNTFTGKTRIHFEQAVSGDGNSWDITGSGETVKRPGGN
jgi:hypothetical protein